MLSRIASAIACTLVVSACGPTLIDQKSRGGKATLGQAGGANGAAAQGVGIQPQIAVPSPKVGRELGTEEEAEAARRDLDYLEDADPARLTLRRSLLSFYVRSAERAYVRGHLEDAFESFSSALLLFQPEELADSKRPPKEEDAPGLFALAERLDRGFRKRGAHPEVVTALMVQISLRPDDPGAKKRYQELALWLSGNPGSTGPIYRGQRKDLLALINEPPTALISDLETTSKLWPSALVVSELAPLYLVKESSFGLPSGRSNLRDFLSASGRTPPLQMPAFKLARLYLRTSQPEEGIKAIRSLPKLSQPEQTLLQVMERAFAKGAQPSDTVGLALGMSQSSDDIDVSLQLCRDLVVRFPRAVVAYQCVGELAGKMERTGLAVRAYERARELAPKERALWERLALLYQIRLSDLVGDERTQELEGALKQIEGFQGLLRAQFPDAEVAANMSAALAEVGRGYYNAGRIDEAVRYLERSLNIEANPAALELLGTIYLKKEQGDRALAALERARAVESASKADPIYKLYVRARLTRLIAEALELRKESSNGPSEARRAALRDWERLLESERLSPERRAEAELEKGKLFYQLGERTQAIAAFQAAVDAVPEDGNKNGGQVYADAIAFLVQRGELEEALDAYHRALGRARVTEYLKVYCSLWVNDLARRAGQAEDPLATAFLKSVGGGKWYAELSRWATKERKPGQGQEQMDGELLLRADTVGKKAEAYFYMGMRKLASGDQEGGKALLQKVLESEMLAFFEYEMANLYLKKGAPTKPVLKSKDKQQQKRDGKRPPGSI